jgi:HEAT repeat protein
MNLAVISVAVLGPILLAAAFLLGRHLPRRKKPGEALSAVTRQHLDLFQGGQLSQRAVEAAKGRLRDLLEQGKSGEVEANLKAGTHYAIQVQALSEIGTDEAGRILERQLQRRLTDDELEQSWYWIDLAHGLRNLQREQSLPKLLRCAEVQSDNALGQFLAAETICFLTFAGYLRHPASPLGQSALRTLQSALVGLRSGVPPQVMLEARLGELVETVWDNKPDSTNPLTVRVLAEALRLLNRAEHFSSLLAEEPNDQEAFAWQLSRLASLRSELEAYLRQADEPLCRALKTSHGSRQADILIALRELRAECATVVLPLLEKGELAQADLAVDALTWSRDPQLGRWLCDWARRNVPIESRTRPRWIAFTRCLAVPDAIPYLSVLRALRGHPSLDAEQFLLLASSDGHPACRAAALSSLGWWEPWAAGEVTARLRRARQDPYPEVRRSARAALARLGECQALQWFRTALRSPDSLQAHEAIQSIAEEGLVLLWPDLDHLADSEDVGLSFHAREALEQMREDLEHRNR